jgi:hypothetical protein
VALPAILVVRLPNSLVDDYDSDIGQRFPNLYTLRPPFKILLQFTAPTQGATGLTGHQEKTAATLLGTVDKQKKSLRQSFVITQCLQKLSIKLNF